MNVKTNKVEKKSAVKTNKATSGSSSARAIVQLNCKQFFVEVGSRIKCELVDAAEGEELTFDKVLLLSDDKGVKVGAPYVSGKSVVCKVVEHARHKKVVIFKKNRRHVYQKKQGHRQHYTKLEVMAIK